MDILTVGEALVCFAPTDSRLAEAETLRRTIGGAEFNTAVGLARLGRSVTWCSRVGADPFGEEILAVADREGIDHSLVKRVNGFPTGVMFKDPLSPHLATTYYYRHGSAASLLAIGDVPLAAIRNARHVHVTGISMWIGAGPGALVADTLGAARESGASTTFDPNFRPQLASVESMRTATLDVLPLTTTFLCNEYEATAITGIADALDAAVEISSRGPTTVIVKRGAAGVAAVIDGERFEQSAWRVETPIDPVGAGDAFNAGWIHAQLAGFDPSVALAFSGYVAAQVVAHHSDHDGFPLLADTDDWLATHGSTIPDERTTA